MVTTICKSLVNLKAKSAAKFDQDKIKGLWVQEDQPSLNMLQEIFKVIHPVVLKKAWKDETKEEALVVKHEPDYNKVMEKIYESLQLTAEYEA